MKAMIRYSAVAFSALAALLLTPSTAAAQPTDTVFPIPLVGIASGPTGFLGPFVAGYVKATVDPALPGIAQFAGVSGNCMCVVHWRNITTGAAGSTSYWFAGPSDEDGLIETGPGVVTAVATAGGAIQPITFVPGAGVFLVP